MEWDYDVIAITASHDRQSNYRPRATTRSGGSLNRYHYQVGFSHGSAWARRVHKEPRTPRPL